MVQTKQSFCNMHWFLFFLFWLLICVCFACRPVLFLAAESPPEKNASWKTDEELKQRTLSVHTSTDNQMNPLQNKNAPSISSSSICRLVFAVITNGQTITMTVFIALRRLILSVEGPDPALHAAINKMWHPHTQPHHPACPVCTVSLFFIQVY